MKTTQWAFLLLAFALAACGGGGSSPPPAPLKLTGTAAKGAALAGALVQVSCATGSGSATTAADGSYTVSIDGGALPCVLRAPLGDGSFVHSAIGGSGSGDFTVNISPLTELVVARATGVEPDTLFAEFAARRSAVTTAALSDAVAAIKVTLNGVVDLGTANPLSDPAAVGSALDQKIDALVASLASNGTSLAELTQTVAASSPANPTPPPATSGTASLPADLLLKPAAANCTALRSGTYRAVYFQASNAGQYATETLTIDTAALTVTPTRSGATARQLIALGTCRFLVSDGTELVVSQAGVVSLRFSTGPGTFANGIAFPEQTHAVAELAGSWNALGWERDTPTATTYHAIAFNVVFGSDGKPTSGSACDDVKTCAPIPAAELAFLTLTANAAAGGFDLTSSDPADPYVDRLFAYRAGGGELMLVSISGNGSFSLLTRERTNDPPTVGNISRNFDLSIGRTLASTGSIAESGNTILTVDTASNGFTRSTFGYLNNGTVFATWNQSLQRNTPRNGYTLRIGETAVPTNVAGVTATNREFVALGMRGMGFSAVELPANNVAGDNAIFLISVSQPNIAWLAPELIARPYAANCSFLRSGSYHVVTLAPAPAGQFPSDTVSLNATTLVLTNSDNSTEQWTANGNCRFSNPRGSSLVVSPAGVIVGAGAAAGTAGIAIPVQAHAVDELAGIWNKLGFANIGGGAYSADAATATFNGSGRVTAITACNRVTTASCTVIDPLTKNIQFSVNAAGGFDIASADGPGRAFAYRAGNGELMLVTTSGDGSIGLWTQQRVNALPTVGARTRNWDLNISTTLVPTISDSANTIASVDTATGNVVRTRIGGNGATWSETLNFNKPRDGYNFRPAGSTTDSLGAAVTINDFTSLTMRGMGFSPLKLINGTTSAEFFLISVNKP